MPIAISLERHFNPESAEWPNASNTGIAGVGLVVGDLELVEDDILVDEDNTILEDLHVIGTITVEANNVTIRRCYIEGSFFGIITEGDPTGLVIEDCTLEFGDNASIAVGDEGATVRRCNIFGGRDGIKAGANFTLEDSYIHDLDISGEDPHNDGVQFGSVSNITIRHNWIESPDTSCLAWFFGQVSPGSGVLIEDNHFQGGGYCIYFPSTDGTGFQVLNNEFGNWGFDFQTDWFDDPSNVWSGNIDFTTGLPVVPV